MTDNTDFIRIVDSQTLSNDFSTLKKTIFDYRRRDGTWQQLTRETYDRGDSTTVLLYNRARRTVVLTRQFRFPAYVNGVPDGMLLETPAGKNEAESPDTRIRSEIKEETGYDIGHVTPLFDAFSSPGSITEKVSFFVAEYDASKRQDEGGGLADEGEDIEVLEMPLDEALGLIQQGQIQDLKTITLLYHAALYLFE
ncbi:nudix-type nucleoside diphosphatase (YffH/AdpP family) [Pseudomonas duriflava]|uniref:GDP-mannose pyrophosphatase n=1 Tax=Pseudomonas duriflava TaxID=459528 RepID=A0A562QNL4_9PSED|nr:NUDIX domain-containing protein [Pseudomonas duriflava]TWI58348.1 nudix-type nucleoside diphosphatase (YffH/AdpP family) [Pseudomonas duriflava]